MDLRLQYFSQSARVPLHLIQYSLFAALVKGEGGVGTLCAKPAHQRCDDATYGQHEQRSQMPNTEFGEYLSVIFKNSIHTS